MEKIFRIEESENDFTYTLIILSYEYGIPKEQRIGPFTMGEMDALVGALDDKFYIR